MQRELNELQRTITAIELLKQNEAVTVGHLAAVVGCSRDQAKKALDGLVPVNKCHRSRFQFGKRWLNVWTTRERPAGAVVHSKKLSCLVFGFPGTEG